MARSTTDPLGTPVAVRFVGAEFVTSNQAIRQLRRDVLLARRVIHPNVCRVYDLGGHGKKLYISMEAVSGATLAELLEGSTLTGEQAVSIVLDILRGLEAIHAAGVVHGELKLANVIVTSQGRVVVSNFGLAHDRDTTRRGDIYALGRIADQILPATLGPRARKFRRVIARCLHPDPRSRYASARLTRAAFEAARTSASKNLRASLVGATTSGAAVLALAGLGALEQPPRSTMVARIHPSAQQLPMRANVPPVHTQLILPPPATPSAHSRPSIAEKPKPPGRTRSTNGPTATLRHFDH